MTDIRITQGTASVLVRREAVIRVTQATAPLLVRRNAQPRITQVTVALLVIPASDSAEALVLMY